MANHQVEVGDTLCDKRSHADHGETSDAEVVADRTLGSNRSAGAAIVYLPVRYVEVVLALVQDHFEVSYLGVVVEEDRSPLDHELPMGAPATLFYGAERERLRAHTARAQRLVGRSLLSAERLGMPYEQALAHLALGRLAPAPSPLRPFHLAEARRLFGAMGCAYHLRLVAAEQREMGDQAA